MDVLADYTPLGGAGQDDWIKVETEFNKRAGLPPLTYTANELYAKWNELRKKSAPTGNRYHSYQSKCMEQSKFIEDAMRKKRLSLEPEKDALIPPDASRNPKKDKAKANKVSATERAFPPPPSSQLPQSVASDTVTTATGDSAPSGATKVGKVRYENITMGPNGKRGSEEMNQTVQFKKVSLYCALGGGWGRGQQRMGLANTASLFVFPLPYNTPLV
jgi:hypothetical protein